MAKTVNCTEEVIVVSHGDEDIGKLAALGANGQFHPSVIPAIADLQSQISQEAAARTDADKQLKTNIDAEASARTVGDQQLQDQIAKEAANGTNADNVLQANIDAEANARTIADKELQDQITKEMAARTEGDTTLQSNIDAEVAARTDADSKLQISINTEVDARAKADQCLQDQITAEITAQSEADKQLQANIDNAKTEANSYTDTKVAGLVNDAPGALDTLKELADALNNDSNFAATVTNQLAQKADKSQIPTSLPANGGNADTVDGKHASDIIEACSIYAVPSGAIQHFARQTAPDGWLKADGSAISRTQYAKLFAAVGTVYGIGDGSTTFNLPDLRGEFVRGFDDGRGVDQGRLIGSLQNDALKKHLHMITTVDISNTAAFTFNDHSGDAIVSTDNVGGWGSGDGIYGYGERKVDRYSTESSGETETRPRNIALLACIKY